MMHREAAFSAKPLQEKCFHDKESAASLLETKKPARWLQGVSEKTPSLLGNSLNKEGPGLLIQRSGLFFLP